MKTSLSEAHRIRTRLSMTNHVIAFLKELTDYLKSILKDNKEVFTFILSNLPNQRKIKRNSTNVATANSNGFVCLRVVPLSEICTATHRTRDSTSALIDFAYLTMVQTKVVRVHTLTRTFHSLMEKFLMIPISFNLILIIEEDELREDNLLTPMPLHTGIKDNFTDQLHDVSVEIIHHDIPRTKGKCSESEVTARTRNSVELQFKRLKSLFKFTLEIPHSHCTGFIILHVALFGILLKSVIVGLLSVRKENLINLCKCEPTELLSSSHKGDVTDNLKGTKDTRRFSVLHVGHLKATLKDITDVKETTIK